MVPQVLEGTSLEGVDGPLGELELTGDLGHSQRGLAVEPKAQLQDPASSRSKLGEGSLEGFEALSLLKGLIRRRLEALELFKGRGG